MTGPQPHQVVQPHQVAHLYQVAQRAAVAPFYVMQLFEAAELRRATGLPVYNLAVGQPSTPAPFT